MRCLIRSLPLALVLPLLGVPLSVGGCAARQGSLDLPSAARPVLPGDVAPSPATVECAVLGGRTQFLAGGREHPGLLGLCRLDRAVIDEWTLFWAVTNHEFNDAAQAFLDHPPISASALAGDPVAAYCAAVGGRPVRLLDEDGRPGGMCRFADGSLIEERTLLGGPGQVGNLKLATLLR